MIENIYYSNERRYDWRPATCVYPKRNCTSHHFVSTPNNLPCAHFLNITPHLSTLGLTRSSAKSHMSRDTSEPVQSRGVHIIKSVFRLLYHYVYDPLARPKSVMTPYTRWCMLTTLCNQLVMTTSTDEAVLLCLDILYASWNYRSTARLEYWQSVAFQWRPSESATRMDLFCWCASDGR